MKPEDRLPPATFLEALAYFGIEFEGWYAEAAEGIASRYEEDPDETLAVADQMEEQALAA
jgi:hypothetical protein